MRLIVLFKHFYNVKLRLEQFSLMLPNSGAKHTVFLRVEWAPIRITPSPPRPFIRHSLLVVDRRLLLIKLSSGNLPVSDSAFSFMITLQK